MKTASTRLLDEEFDTLRGFCQDNNTNINELLGGLIQRTLKGKIKPRSTKFDSRLDFCPRCGHSLHLVQGDDSSKLYFICLGCDWAACVGYYKLPEQIEDYQKIKGAR